MSIGDRIRDGLRSFLRIEPADRRFFDIKAEYDFAGNAYKNLIWYQGDAHDLDAFYRQTADYTGRFWCARPSKGFGMRKLHTGIPTLIVDSVTNIVISDLNDFSFENVNRTDLWNDVAEENRWKQLLSQAVKDVLVIGDGAFKISMDPKISSNPIIEWYSGLNCDFEYTRGRVTGVTFYSHYKDRDSRQMYVLHEIYRKGSIEYRLFKETSSGEGAEVELSTLKETADLMNAKFGDYMLAVPFMIKSSSRFKGRGESIFDKKIDNFDALDEAYSQLWQAMRAARPVKYIPDIFIPRDVNNGSLVKPNDFDNQFIAVSSDMSENAHNQITVTQPEFRSAEYLNTYMTALDLALQGLVSPSTLGIDVKKLDNAEAQREKEKTTLYTRQSVIEALTPVIQKVVNGVFNFVDNLAGLDIVNEDVNVNFGGYANPSFEAVVETMSNPNTPMSIEAKVEELWGDTKDAEWKEEEVRRIKEQTGVTTMDEPALGTGIGTKSINIPF